MIESPAEIVREYLINQSLVSLPSNSRAWPMFVGHITDVERIDVCTIYDTTPLKDGRIIRSGEVIFHYGIQVATRSIEYEIGWLQDDQLQRKLCAIHNEDVIVNSITWRLLNLTKMSAAFIGIDEIRRNVFTANFISTIERIN